MKILLNNNDLNEALNNVKNLGFVPTMGSLHKGHISLIKESLRKRTNEAYEKGIFGAPSFVANNKIFWGQDRIEFALNEASK